MKPYSKIILNLLLVLSVLINADLCFASQTKSADSFPCFTPDDQQKIIDMFGSYKMNQIIADGFLFESISIGQDDLKITITKDEQKASLLLSPKNDASTDVVGVFEYKFNGVDSAKKSLDLLLEQVKASSVNPYSSCLFEIVADNSSVLEHQRYQRPLGKFGLLVLFLLLFIFVFLTWFFHKRRYKTFTLLGLLFCSSIATLFLLELGMLLFVDYWAMHIKLADGCYYSNPRGYFKPSRVSEEADSDELKVYCTWGGQKAWEECASQSAKIYPNKIRLLALGDSFTEAIGVFYEDSWPKQLEVLMNNGKAKNQQQAFVANCGLAGANLSKIIKRSNEFSDRHDPQIVIYNFVLNDVVVPHGFDGSKLSEISFQFEDRESYQQHLRLNKFFGSLVDNIALLKFFAERQMTADVAEQTEQMYLNMYSSPIHKVLADSLDLIAELAHKNEKNGKKFLLVISPMFYELSDYPLRTAHALLVKELSSRGVMTLDLLNIFQNMDEKLLQVHPTDYHPNEVAQQKTAMAIFEELKRLGWLSK